MHEILTLLRHDSILIIDMTLHYYIRIFSGCKVQIENSIKRVIVRYHEAYHMMANSYPEWWNFQFAPHNHFGFFFLHTLPSTIAFKLEYALFYKFYSIISICSQDLFGSVPQWRWHWNVWWKMTQNIKTTSWCHAQESSYFPHVRAHFLAPVSQAEIPVGYARNCFLAPQARFSTIFTSADKSYLT